MKQVDANDTISEPERQPPAQSLPPIEGARRQQRARHSTTQAAAYHRLIEACKVKDLNRIRSILGEQPELVNQRDKHKRSLLHYTAILVLGGSGDDEWRAIASANDDATDKRLQLEQQQRSSIECLDYLTSRCELRLWWQQDLDGLSLLHLAVISSNVALVRHVVFEHPYSSKYPLVCVLDNEHHSALHWAVITNDLECVKVLVGFAGAKLAHEPDLNGATPLHYATQTNDYPKYRQQLRLMLMRVSESALDPPSVAGDGAGCDEEAAATAPPPPSSVAASQPRRELEILEYLARLPGINLECLDKDRRTPLLWAASSGQRDAVALLVACGAQTNSCDVNKLSALHCAASHGFTDCLECLLNRGSGGKRASSQSSSSSFVNQPDNLNCTPLFYSVLSGNIDCVEILLERGAKQDWQDTKGRTAAHFAALKGQLNTLKLLQERGANLWLANKQGDLPLHYAIKSGRQQVVRWLLENSPYERAVNAINNVGRAPIHLAIAKDNLPMVEYLIRCGANLNQLVKVRNGGSSSNKSASSQVDLARATTTTGRDQGSDERLATAAASQQQQPTSRPSGQYHYETALDMAKKLGHRECLSLLVDNKALSAAQVMSNRMNAASGRPGVRSLFDLQSVDGPSPIGFETSSSSGSPTIATLTTTEARQRQRSSGEGTAVRKDVSGAQTGASGLPQLARPPAPGSLPETDSTRTSSLSQSSFTSVRDGGSQHHHEDKQQQQQQQQQRQQQHGDEDDDDEEEQQEGGGKRPYRGGISYNNEHINASIKYKLYDCEARRAYQRHHHRTLTQSAEAGEGGGGSTDERPTRQSGRVAAASVRGRTSQSAPISGAGHWRGQEIVTNVNVYTSPCPHCVHHQHDLCSLCSAAAAQEFHQQQSRQPADSTSGRTGAGVYTQDQEAARSTRARDAAGQHARQQEQQSFYSDETSDGASTEPETELRPVRRQLPSLVNVKSAQQEQHQAQVVSADGSSVFQHPRVTPGPFRSHLPPSQGHEQHLPAIMSDQERSSTSGATSNDGSPQIGAGDEDEDGDGDDSRARPLPHSHQAAARTISPADQEPRFDRSRRRQFEEGHRTTSLRENIRYSGRGDHQQVRSPVAEYIRAPLSGGPTPASSPLRVGSLARSPDGGLKTRHLHHHHQLPDFSQVKAKVGSYRGPDDPLRSKSMTTLQQQQQQHASELEAPGGSRSVSRQTVTLRPRGQSVDSVELASSIERAIWKYRQEKRLFEELEQLKRNQIRSGRANEALLVKRLVEHFRNDTLDLVDLGAYHGPYTYKSYERFLYDQLRKLSHSNCAKLGRQYDDYAGHYDYQAADAAAEQDALDEDLRAELELRRVIEGGGGGDGGDDGSKLMDAHRAPDETADETEMATMEDSQDLHLLQREWIGDKRPEQQQQEKQDTDGDADKLEPAPRSAAGADQVVSADSSRRSSIEIERDRLLNLPLKVAAAADEQSRQAPNIEDQAISLTSKIIVDALGNVSRSGSPEHQSPEEKEEEEVEEAAKAAMIASGESRPTDRLELAPTMRDDDGDQRDEDHPFTGEALSGRRRSVVNIGNKVEIIYHDVGIEIDPAATDSDRESLSLAGELAAEGARGGEKSGDDDLATEAAAAESLAGGVEETVEEEHKSAPSSSSTSSVGSGSTAVEVAHKPLGELEEDGATLVATTREDEPAMTTEPKLIGKEEEETHSQSGSGADDDGKVELVPRSKFASSKTKIDRRESSPPAHRMKKGPVAPEICDKAAARRASSDTKKVFTGYDLDEWHRLNQRRAPVMKDLDVEGGGAGAGARVIAPDSTVDGRRKASDDGSGARLRSEEMIGQQQAAAAQAKRRAAGGTVSPTRRRLTPSRLPKGRYRVKVPMAAIRRRWAQIRSEERRRGGGRSLLLLDEAEADGGLVARRQAAKSQPNLRKDDRKFEEDEDDDEEWRYSNYTLMYEINKQRRSRSAAAAVKITDEGGERKQVTWCHKKLARIVDVRTLKRTLSLPESLMYSNDLLKRFNILKL